MDKQDFGLLKKIIASEDSVNTEESKLNFNSPESFSIYRANLHVLKINGLIIYVDTYKFTVTELGYKASIYDSWSEYIKSKIEKENKTALKEDLEFKKLKMDYDLLSQKTKDYETTKALSWISIFIGIALSILKIIEWIG